MKLMVIDGNSIINRAYYGIRLLTTRDGTPTNGVYGFLTTFLKLMAEEKPDAACVTFDCHAPTFRHEKYDGYKAQRKPMPEELAVQLPVLKKTLDAMNVKRYELEGWEADDLIGTIAKNCENAGWNCVVVTGDKDSFQLISEKTAISHVKSRMGQTETKIYTVPVFEEEYGFEPKKIIDLKALMGDSSDNIPGVAGVGEKTAFDLIRRFGSVEEIYSGLDSLDIKDSVKKKLSDGRDNAIMSYDLATISTDAPIDFAPEENIVREYDNDELYRLFTQLEFSKLMDRFSLVPPSDAPVVEKPVALPVEATSESEVTNMLKALKKARVVSVRHNESLDTVALYNCDCGTVYVVEKGKTSSFEEILTEIFSDSVKKAGHSIKNTQILLIKRGYGVAGWVFDTELAAYLLSPTDSNYELSKITKIYCGYELDGGGEAKAQLSLLDEEPEDERLEKEATAIFSLESTLSEKLEKTGLLKLLAEIEIPLCEVLAYMEGVGFLVDRDAITAYGRMLAEKIAEEEKEIFALSGTEFNVNSPKQLGEVLFEKLMLPAPKKTKTGYSTNADVLDSLMAKHPIIKRILNFRQYSKLKSTYADGLLKVAGTDGRVHTQFQMTVTATGRLSSTEPNLQNIPVRKELGGELRKMFIAGEGNVLVDADYSQIELRLLAHIADDKIMREAFISGEDIHSVTASQVFGVPLKEVTPLQRSRAKAVNFGIVYGISAFSLSQDIGVFVNEAKEYMDNYLEKYSGVRAYMHNIVAQAERDGFVATLFGRRRYLPELKSSNFNIRAFGKRVALNMPVQGTAADIMKLAMINSYRRLKSEGLQARLVLQVHDELIAECPESEAEIVKRVLTEEMENAVSLSVPLTAEAHAGKSWFDVK